MSLRTFLSRRRLPVIGVALIAAARLAFAGPAAQETRDCASASPTQARSLGDALFDRAEYERAGRCYEVAGDFARANDAFLKAVAPQGEDTARQLAANREKAKAQFRNIGRAFKSNH